MIDHPRISIKTCENEQLIFEAPALLRESSQKNEQSYYNKLFYAWSN